MVVTQKFRVMMAAETEEMMNRRKKEKDSTE
jgi:hypothetical protein